MLSQGSNSMMQQSHSMPSGVDSTGVTGSTPERKKAAKNVVSVKVKLLDESVSVFQIQHKALGKVLFDQVCKMLNLLESDYFGLEYEDHTKTSYWLDTEKQMNRQIGLSLIDPILHFCVKFFTPDPAQLEEPYTRYLFAVQIKQDLAQGILQCNDNTAALMASYIIQAECGDYMEEDYPDHSYLSSYKFVPHQDADMERRIMEHYKKNKGQTPEIADLNLLETARRCELFGIRMSKAKDHEGVPLKVAVAHMGILVFQNFTKINTFSWAKIRKLSFKKKRFLIKLHPEGYGYYKDTVDFYFDGRNECKNFWKKCIEHHGFFRCTVVKPVPRQKAKIFSRGSSFRYSGKTQKEIVDYVRSNFIKRQPFQRSSSCRITRTTGRETAKHANMGRSVSTHLPVSESEHNFAQPSNTVSTPVSQSCGSVTLTDKSGDELSPSKDLPMDMSQQPSNNTEKAAYVDAGPPPGSVIVYPCYSKSSNLADTYDFDYDDPSHVYHIPPPEGFCPESPIKRAITKDTYYISNNISDTGLDSKSKKSPKPPKRNDSTKIPHSKMNSVPPPNSDQLKNVDSKLVKSVENETVIQQNLPSSQKVSPATLPRTVKAQSPGKNQVDSQKEEFQPPTRAVSQKVLTDDVKAPDIKLQAKIVHEAISHKLRKPGTSTQSLPDQPTDSHKITAKPRSAETVSVSVNTDPLDFDLSDSQTDLVSEDGCIIQPISDKSAKPIVNQFVPDKANESHSNVIRVKTPEDTRRVNEKLEAPETKATEEKDVSNVKSQPSVTKEPFVGKQHEDIGKRFTAIPSPPASKPKSSPKITTVTIVKRKVEKTVGDRSISSPPPTDMLTTNTVDVVKSILDGSGRELTEKFAPSVEQKSKKPQNVPKPNVCERIEPEKVSTPAASDERTSEESKPKPDINEELQYVLRKRYVMFHSVDKSVDELADHEKLNSESEKRISLETVETFNEPNRNDAPITEKLNDNAKMKSKVPPAKPPRENQRGSTDTHHVTLKFTDPDRKSGCIFKEEKILVEECKISDGHGGDEHKHPGKESQIEDKSAVKISKRIESAESSLSCAKTDEICVTAKEAEPSHVGKLAEASGDLKNVYSKLCKDSGPAAVRKPDLLDMKRKDSETTHSKAPLRRICQKINRKETPAHPVRTPNKENVDIFYISSKESEFQDEVVILPSGVKTEKIKPIPPPKPKKKPAVPPKPTLSPKPTHLTKNASKNVDAEHRGKKFSDEAKKDANADASTSLKNDATGKTMPKSPKTIKSPVLYSRWKPLVPTEEEENDRDTVVWVAPKSPKSGRSIDIVPLSLLPSSDSYSFKDDTISSKSPDSEILEKLIGDHATLQAPPIPPFPKCKELSSVKKCIESPTAQSSSSDNISANHPPLKPPLPLPLHPDYTNIYIGHTFRALSRISEGSQSEPSQSDGSPPREMVDISSDSERSTSQSDHRSSYCSSDASGANNVADGLTYENNMLVIDDNASDSSNIDRFYLDINSDEREELEKQLKFASGDASDFGSSSGGSAGEDTLCGDEVNKSMDDDDLVEGYHSSSGCQAHGYDDSLKINHDLCYDGEETIHDRQETSQRESPEELGGNATVTSTDDKHRYSTSLYIQLSPTRTMMQNQSKSPEY